MGAKEADDLRRRTDDLHREKAELTGQFELSQREQERLTREK